MTAKFHDMTNVPQARSVKVFFCVGPECKRPHVILFDDSKKPIAQFVVPDRRSDGTGFVNDFLCSVIESEMMRGIFVDGDRELIERIMGREDK